MAPILSAFAAIAITVTAILGWIMNIMTIFSSFDLMSTGEAVVRVAGIIIPIIGAIVGWF